MTKKQIILHFILFFVVGFAIYGHTLQNDFVFDDEEQIVNNTVVHDIGNWQTAFTGSTMNQGGSQKLGGIYYKPIMTLSYMTFWHFFENWPAPYRFFQVSLHVLNSLLLLFFLLPFVQHRWALAAGLIFLTHPLNTETTIYIADLQDTLYFFFGIMGLVFLQRRQTIANYAFVAFCFLLSLLSKETGAGFLALGILFPFFFPLPKRSFYYGLLIISASIYGFMRFGMADLMKVNHGVALIARADWVERFFTAPKALLYYFWKLVHPVNLTLTQNWVVSQPTFTDFWLPLIMLMALFIFVGWLVLGQRGRKSFYPLCFSALWILGGLFIHSHLMAPLDGTVADRWFYFTFAGVLVLGAMVLSEKVQLNNKGLIGVGLVALVLGALSVQRGAVWRNGYTLYGNDVKITPGSYDLQNNYGVELFRRGQYGEALEHFQRSVEIAPHWTINWNNLGAAYERHQKLREAEKAYCRSIKNGVYYVAFENYAGILIKTNRLNEAYDFITQIGLVALPYNKTLVQMKNILADSSEGEPIPNKEYQLICPD